MTAAVAFKEPVKVLAEILQKEMNLPDGQIMLAYEQDIIPRNPGLFVALNYVSSRMIGGNGYARPSSTGMQETLAVAMLHLVQIDILSFDASARIRKEEVLQSLLSIAAEMAMDANAMQIGRIPTDFTNTSSLEETKMLNRFSITVTITALHRKVKETADYFDKFHTEFITDTDTDFTEADPNQLVGG